MTRLYIVSLGPGSPDLVTPRAAAAIGASSELVGYGLYLELLGAIRDGKTLHELPLGKETERARLALDLAAGGRVTSLVSGGDAGIYAMATLVFELLDRHPDGALRGGGWHGVEIEVIPGISAMQAVASRCGAILGHDFCAISLSDLLTPWETIARRLHAAGAGDFVISLYNPRSGRRNWQIDAAREILLEYRPSATPVIIGQQLTRRNERIRVVRLSELEAGDIDMFTLVSVGNSESRRLETPQQEWVYTPRGYGRQS